MCIGRPVRIERRESELNLLTAAGKTGNEGTCTRVATAP